MKDTLPVAYEVGIITNEESEAPNSRIASWGSYQYTIKVFYHTNTPLSSFLGIFCDRIKQ